MKDPQNYIGRFVTEVRCPVYPDRPALLEPSMRVWVNHESWFVSDDEARRKFVEDPLAWITTVTDPVEGARFRPDRQSPRHDYRGRPYFFRSTATRDQFVADPASYAEPRREMKRAAAG